MKRALWILPLLAVCLLVAADSGRCEDDAGAPDAADERILFFRSEITVVPDASIGVRETIRVRAAGREIKHGIYRDFPTRFRGPDGVWFTVPFRVTEVLRDGKPEPWLTREREDGIRASIGNPDLLLEPGEHTYTIAYTTDRQLGFFKDHVGLFWNVTGYNWTFPMDEVEARVLLPHGVAGVSLDVATGARGSKEREATASWGGDGGALFRSLRALQPGEGLRVIAKWPRGFVHEPVEPRRWWQSFLDSNRSAVAGLAGLLLVLTYYLLTGRQATRDRDRGIVLPGGELPAGLSAAAMRVARTGTCDERAFAATVVHMAVTGYLLVEERGGRYTLRRRGASREVLAPEEALVADDLDLDWAGQIGIERANRLRIGSAVNDLKNLTRVSLERLALNRNREYLLPGVLLSVIVLGSTLSLEPGLRSYTRGLISLLLFFWTLAVSLLAVQLAYRWQDVFLRRGELRDTLFHAASITVLAVPVFIAEIVGLALMAWLGSLSYVAVLLGVALLTAYSHYRLKAPTAAGRRLLVQIERFAAALSAAEAEGVSRLAPEPTPALFEKFLPYAIALDCEERWSAQCAAALTYPGGDGRSYRPAWCAAVSGDGAGRPAPVAQIVGSALCAAIAAATGGTGGVARTQRRAHGVS